MARDDGVFVGKSSGKGFITVTAIAQERQKKQLTSRMGYVQETLLVYKFIDDQLWDQSNDIPCIQSQSPRKRIGKPRG